MKDIEYVYNKYSQIVYKYIYCLTKEKELSEEIVQETFLVAVKDINKFKGKCKISTWLCQIAKNIWYNNLRKEKNVDLLYVKKEFHSIGIVEIESPLGQKIKVYDLERTICDIIKFKNKIDPEIFSKALKEYTRSKTKNLNNLIIYARKLKVEDEVRKYLEVLL